MGCVPNCFISHLKIIEFKVLICGEDVEKEKYFLKNAKVLEKVKYFLRIYVGGLW